MKALLTALAISMGTGLASAQAQDRVLRIHHSADNITLDWARSASELDLPLILNIQEGLTSLGRDFKVQPALAESWSYDETGTVIHFLIRKQATWSDGRPVRAADFVAAFENLLSRTARLPNASLLFDVSGAKEYFDGKYPDFSSVGVKATSDRVLRVQLKEPNWFWVEKTTLPAMYPMRADRIAQKGAQWTLPGNLLSTGPFIYASKTDGKEFVLKKNGNYKLFDVQPEKLIFDICPPEEALMKARAGQLDLIPNLPAGAGKEFAKNPAFRVLENPFDRIRKVDFNLKRYPTSLKDLREALVRAISNPDLVKTLNPSWAPATSWQLPGALGYSPKPTVPTDVIKARALIRTIFPSNTLAPAKLKMLIPNFDENRGEQVEIGNYLKAQWRKILGVEVEMIVAESYSQYLLLRDTGEFHLLLRDFSIDTPDSLSFYEPYGSGGRLGYQWTDPSFDQFIQEARRTKDLKKRKDLLMKLNDFLLAKEIAVMPLFYKGTQTLVRSDLKGRVGQFWKSYHLKEVKFPSVRNFPQPGQKNSR